MASKRKKATGPEPRSQRFNIDVTPTELAAYKAAAATKGVSMSTWARLILGPKAGLP